ncbi:MAG: hypothetical protein RBT69_01000 [Spirochaetia bacterium]|jgi:hypothetical protein|nr:hypothetical protein [Spirochaetia bacterium]
MKMIFPLLLILLTFSFPVSPVSADESYSELVPEEYKDEEFSPFLRDLRRAEVIFIGSYPFAVVFTKIGSGIFDYASSGFARSKAPALFGGAEKGTSSSDETKRILISSLYVSLSITAADFIIGKIKKQVKNENKRNY